MELKNDRNIDFKSKKFWIMIFCFLILFGWICASFIVPIAQNAIEVNKINKFINKNHITSLDEFIATITSIENKNNWSELIWYDKNNNYKGLSNVWIHFLTTNSTKNDGTIIVSIKALFDPFEHIIFNLSYFTVLSNILITVIFGYCVFKPKWIGKIGILKPQYILNASTFITITFLIYNFAMFPVGCISYWSKYGPYADLYQLFQNTFLHVINPLIYIIYALVFVDYDLDLQNLKKENLKQIKVSIVILICYGAYIMVRGGIKMLCGSGAKDSTAWPYFFLEPFAPNPIGSNGFPGLGLIVMIIFIIIIALIAIGFGLLNMKIVSKRMAKKTAVAN